jgi:hypothetical protein
MPMFLLGGGSLACYLIWGDGSPRAKGILAAVFLASSGLLFVPDRCDYLFPVAQIALMAVIGGMAFGIDWLMKFKGRWP